MAIDVFDDKHYKDLIDLGATSMDNVLAHYGKKGMKWGQRSSPKVREAASEDAERVMKINARVKAGRSARPLSNKELKDAVERMNLEQQYAKLTNGLNLNRREKAAQFVRKLVSDSGKQVTTELTKGAFKDVADQATARAKAQASNRATK